jgi:ubiquitin carboxyl-terminal hydrolase 9/24
MARRDAETNKETEEPEQQVIDSRSGETPPMEITLSVTPENKQINYELVGVVVHSGQANAGHYYSFIKERRSVFN